MGVWEFRLEACNDLGCSPGVTESVTVGVLRRLVSLGASSVSVDGGQPGRVSFGWDVVDGATSYLLRWREVGGEFADANADHGH